MMTSFRVLKDSLQTGIYFFLPTYSNQVSVVRKLEVGFNSFKSLQGDICRDIILLCPHRFSYIMIVIAIVAKIRNKGFSITKPLQNTYLVFSYYSHSMVPGGLEVIS